VVIYLVSIGCDPKSGNNLPVRWAAENGHLNVVKYLVSIGCDPKVRNNLASRWAAQRGHLHFVKYIKNLDVQSETNTHLNVTNHLLAILSDKFDIFRGAMRDVADTV
jgi:ankyrin repeat protein